MRGRWGEAVRCDGFRGRGAGLRGSCLGARFGVGWWVVGGGWWVVSGQRWVVKGGGWGVGCWWAEGGEGLWYRYSIYQLTFYGHVTFELFIHLI